VSLTSIGDDVRVRPRGIRGALATAATARSLKSRGAPADPPAGTAGRGARAPRRGGVPGERGLSPSAEQAIQSAGAVGGQRRPGEQMGKRGSGERGWRKACLGLLLAVCLVCAAAAPPELAQGRAESEDFFGANVQHLFRSGAGPIPAERHPAFMAQMAGDGIRVARMDAEWASAEPQPPVVHGDQRVRSYRWGHLDARARLFAAAGVRWRPILNSSPPWARESGAKQWTAPKRAFFDDFADYAGAFARRYGPGGALWAENPALPPLPVRDFEIWSEPNTGVHWGRPVWPASGETGAEQYADLYDRARRRIRAADPRNRAMIGGIVWNEDVRYVKAMFAAGDRIARDRGEGRWQADSIASHPYAPTAHGVAVNLRRLQRALRESGRTSLPIHVNELGWPAAYDRPPSRFAERGPVSDEARAGTTALVVDALSRSDCRVHGIDVYQLAEVESPVHNVEQLMGIYRDSMARTETSRALAASVRMHRRWTAGPGRRIPLCASARAGGNSPPLLGLRLAATRLAGGCLRPRVTYRGYPVEHAFLRITSPAAAVLTTDAHGEARFCPPSGSRGRLAMTADVPRMAVSNPIPEGAGSLEEDPGAACHVARTSVRHRPSLRRALSAGLPVTVRLRPAERRCHVSVEMVARGGRRVTRDVVVGRGSRLGRSPLLTVRARFSAAQRGRLDRRSSLALRLRVTARDSAGRRSRRTTTLTLRRG
jgi:hypothetical protein